MYGSCRKKRKSLHTRKRSRSNRKPKTSHPEMHSFRTSRKRAPNQKADSTSDIGRWSADTKTQRAILAHRILNSTSAPNSSVNGNRDNGGEEKKGLTISSAPAK